MTAEQYKAAIKRLGLSQGGAAAFLGISQRTSHKYANGGTVPEAVGKLLRLMLKLNLKPEGVK